MPARALVPVGPITVDGIETDQICLGPGPDYIHKSGRRDCTSIIKCKCGEERIVKNHALKRGECKQCKNCWSAALGNFSSERLAAKRQSNLTKYSYNQAYRAHQRSKKEHGCLPEEVWLQLIKKNCHYCNKPPSEVGNFVNPYWSYKLNRLNTRGHDSNMTKESAKLSTIRIMGIDRIDNSKGYTEENSVPCCWKHNKQKRNIHLSEINDMFLILNKMKEHSETNKRAALLSQNATTQDQSNQGKDLGRITPTKHKPNTKNQVEKQS